MSNRSDPTLPIADLFRHAEVRAERLIAYMRLGISSTLALAFAAALTTADVPVIEAIADNELRRWQVIYALSTMGAYFFLGIFCLILIRLGRFRAWMVWPSAAGDCLFILGGIWLGLKNTDLSPDYMIVLPTLWLIPVVLASGVLRFNPRVQAFIILLLVLGLFGIGAANPGLNEAPGFDVLEVFFAGPPNIMRLVMISLAGVVLVVATYRTRALFLRTLSETEQRMNLTRYVPAEVAPELARSGLDALQSGTRQDMAVLFVDMRGFTARAESMPPEALGQFVTEYRRRITQAARNADGIVDKFIGDAVMVVFADHADKASPSARALQCGQDILKRMQDWSANISDPVNVGLGIHFGPVFSGVIGDRERLEYSVFGDAVNIAARLEELTKSTGMAMVVTENVLQNAGASTAEWSALPDTGLRGRKGSLPVFGMPA